MLDTSIMQRRLEVEELYRREVVLLQAGRYLDWLDGFTEDIRYRAPVVRVADQRSEVVAPEGELAYYDETMETLRLRARKLASTLAWTEYPPSRLRYFVQVLVLDEVEDALHVDSNVLCYQTRHDDVEHFFFALRRDRLRQEDGGWKVAHRSVEIDRSRLPSENLSVFL